MNESYEDYKGDEETALPKARKRKKAAGIGHNSGELDSTVSGTRLKAFIERVERLEEEKKAIGEDVRDVYGEAKASGFDPKIMRKIVALRKSNLEKRREEQELLALYAAAIGMQYSLI